MAECSRRLLRCSRLEASVVVRVSPPVIGSTQLDLLATSSGPDRSFLRRFLKGSRAERTPAAVDHIWELLEQHGSLAFASLQARQFANEARARFDKAFASSQPSPALDFLRDMIDYMIDRRS